MAKAKVGAVFGPTAAAMRFLSGGSRKSDDAQSPAAFADLKAPDLADIEALADDAMARLPQAFRELARGVVVRVDDFPTEEVLNELGAETEFDLLGLFTGIGLPQADAVAGSGQSPNLVHLYRRPILDYWAEHEETLGAIVTHVLVHEIGHHFGLSDAAMEAMEAEADAADT